MTIPCKAHSKMSAKGTPRAVVKTSPGSKDSSEVDEGILATQSGASLAWDLGRNTMSSTERTRMCA